MSNHAPVNSTPAMSRLFTLLIALAYTACLLASMAMSASAQENANHAKLDLDFHHAIAEGDAKTIKSLATAVNFDNCANVFAVFDIADLQTVNGGYRYKFSDALLSHPCQPMLDAIQSARVESVQALMDLGVNVKSAFMLRQGGLGFSCPIDPAALVQNARLGRQMSMRFAGGDFIAVAGDGYVTCSVRPILAQKSTYLHEAQQLLAETQDTDLRQRLKQVVDLLKTAGAEEWPVKEARAVDQPEKAAVAATSPAPIHNASVPSPAILTDLMDAALQGNADRIKALIAAGADVNAKNGRSMTALMWAAYNNKDDVDCCRALIAVHAEVNAQDNSGRTALMIAAGRGNAECVKALIAAGADVNAKTSYNYTALKCALNSKERNDHNADNFETIIAALKAAGAQE